MTKSPKPTLILIVEDYLAGPPVLSADVKSFLGRRGITAG